MEEFVLTENEWLHEFAINLRDIMEEDGCSQRDLAEETGISRTTINRYLNEKMVPSATSIVAISHALCVDYNDLIEFGKVKI